MGWLRRDQDCIGLLLVWSLLLQAAILSFSSGMQLPTASQLSGLMCSTRTAATTDDAPAQSRHDPSCQACMLGCHAGCAGVGAAIVPAVRFLMAAFSAVVLKSAQCANPATSAGLSQARAPPRV